MWRRLASQRASPSGADATGATARPEPVGARRRAGGGRCGREIVMGRRLRRRAKGATGWWHRLADAALVSDLGVVYQVVLERHALLGQRFRCLRCAQVELALVVI